MKKELLLPTRFQGINEQVYAGFWIRLAAILLDIIIMLPVTGLVLYLGGLSKSAYFYTIIPNLLFSVFFQVVLVKIYGGTPGKLIMGIKIIQKNSDDVDWGAAFLRYAVQLFLIILGIYIMILSLNLIDESTYISLGFMKRSEFMSSINPIPNKILLWSNSIWILLEIIVLLSNQRKRAVHDFIAGTVVVKSIHLNTIREIINPLETDENTME